MIKLSRLWMCWGRDYYRNFDRWNWTFSAIVNPRPAVTGEGFLICGWHVTLWVERVWFGVRFQRVPPTLVEAA
jgi:hypothetical protein